MAEEDVAWWTGLATVRQVSLTLGVSKMLSRDGRYWRNGRAGRTVLLASTKYDETATY